MRALNAGSCIEKARKTGYRDIRRSAQRTNILEVVTHDQHPHHLQHLRYLYAGDRSRSVCRAGGDVMSTSRRKAGATLQPWLTARTDCREKRFIQVGNSLLLSHRFWRISAGARYCYLCMAMEAGRGANSACLRARRRSTASLTHHSAGIFTSWRPTAGSRYAV